MALTSGQIERHRRRQQNRIIISDPEICHYCQYSIIKQSETVCPSCGFPQKGSDIAMKQFIFGKKDEAKRHKEFKRRVLVSKIILFAIGLVYMAFSAYFIYLYKASINPIGLGIFLGFGIAFFTLGFFTNKHPKFCTTGGMLIYILSLILIGDLGLLFVFWIPTLLIFIALLKGIRSAFKLPKVEKKEIDISILDDGI